MQEPNEVDALVSTAVVTTDEIGLTNSEAVEVMEQKVSKPIISNMAEKMVFDMGGMSMPAHLWYKAKPYDNRMPHQGKREIARQQKRAAPVTVFIPRPSHPDAPVHTGQSRQVLRREARLAAKHYQMAKSPIDK